MGNIQMYSFRGHNSICQYPGDILHYVVVHISLLWKFDFQYDGIPRIRTCLTIYWSTYVWVTCIRYMYSRP